MFFILSKTLYFFLMPLPIIVLLIAAGIFIKNKLWKKRLIISSLGLFLLFSNPFLSNIAMKSWEGSPAPISQLEPHDIGIVLTGITNPYKKPNDRVYITRGADRILHAVQLYKLGLIKKILISGGSGKLINNNTDIKEADKLKNILLLAEIPNSDILIENTSRNTYESAINSCELISNQFKNHSIILITSAFHMPRASTCFSKQRCSFTTFGTDYYSHDKSYNLDDFIVPKSSAIKNWEVIFRELFGMIMYWMLGYI